MVAGRNERELNKLAEMEKILAKSKVRSGIISTHNSLLFQGFKSLLHALFLSVSSITALEVLIFVLLP